MHSNKSGTLKIISGLGLIAGGAIGFIFGRNARSKTLRIIAIALSTLAMGSGFYLLVDGIDDLAVGRVGQYELGGPQVQTMTFNSPSEFEQSLSSIPNEIRRLHFRCSDGSEDFTVFFTHLGIVGVPSQDVICHDGSKLLAFTEAK